jgi:hypothetical protein
MVSSRKWLVVAGITAAVVLGGQLTSAQSRGPKQPLPQKQSNSILQQAITQLHSTNMALKGADHDYGGHRGEAMGAIHAAVKQLKVALKYEKHAGRGAHVGRGAAPKIVAQGGAKGAASPKLPQAQSDAILKQAVVQLVAVEKELSGADHDYGGHRVACMEAVKVAIKQLNVALNWSATHNKQ